MKAELIQHSPNINALSYGAIHEDSENSSDEERTHTSVLSRRLRKRRKTNSSLVSNPFGTPSHSTSDSAKFSSFSGLDDLNDLDDDYENVHDMRRRKAAGLPESDRIARQRCFDYLHTAIDALWAEYCDSTSHAESLKYLPNSPVSEHEDFYSSSGDEYGPASNGANGVHGPQQSSPKDRRHQRSSSISMQPESQSLMRQKKRLVDAKYYLSHFVSENDVQSSSSFWRVWDQLKFTAVELVEGDDDDFDEVIDDLEAGRAWYQ